MNAKEARENTLKNTLPKRIIDGINTAVRCGNHSVRIDKTIDCICADVTLIKLGYKVQNMDGYYEISW